MKNRIYILPIVVLIFATSCEVEIPIWSGQDRVYFQTTRLTDTLQTYSFVYESAETSRHTIEFRLYTEGSLYDFSRTVGLKQVSTGANDAVVNAHYEPLGNVVIPAGENNVIFPVTLIRHSSLQDGERTLRIELVESEHFLPTTNRDRLHRTIVFTDKAAMPFLWTYVGDLKNHFGEYGTVKHLFMIEVGQRPFDDEWFAQNYSLTTYPNSPLYPYPGQTATSARDRNYMLFLTEWLQRRLDERNEREGNILKEEDGTVVVFPYGRVL